MKLKNAINFLAAACMSVLAFTSCLENGDETIALEPGQADEIACGAWQVESATLYDMDQHAYHSDLPENGLLKAVFQLNPEGAATVVQNGNQKETTWDIDDDNVSILVDNVTYTLVSLGTDKMVWECSYYVAAESETYILRYVLVKVGGLPVEEPEQPVPGNEGGTWENAHTLSSSESGTITAGGASLFVPQGAVPKNQNDQDGSVTFSVQQNPGFPQALPSGYSALDGVSYKIEPMNFTFNTPLTLTVPLNGKTASEVALLHYNEGSGVWEEVPLSETDGNTVSAAVIGVGYFVLAEKPQIPSGGIRIHDSYIEPGYEYYLTLTSTTGGTSPKISFTSGNDLYMANIPLGTYVPNLSRKPLSNPGQVEYYTGLPDLITVDGSLTAGTGGFETYQGWNNLELTGNGSWQTGRPSAWGDATVTYGTGYFQATLTWVNSTGSIVDYDLHLTGPNSTHIYFGSKNNSYFELDRDWTSPLGNAIENIYSINETMPAGTYTVYVNLFSGVKNKPFNCRIILNGTVVKSVSSSISSGNQTIYTFTIE